MPAIQRTKDDEDQRRTVSGEATRPITAKSDLHAVADRSVEPKRSLQID